MLTHSIWVSQSFRGFPIQPKTVQEPIPLNSCLLLGGGSGIWRKVLSDPKLQWVANLPRLEFLLGECDGK